ncbi:protein of unknown function [Georgfuchsia toluolica]|uniref:Uncharacterized protein n=1 Tax=Georgfuchsia toluolica TaxID=424218 RepID=A0A916J5S1_9PROT|nr:hypothetical protein [Georgfuchsia toluolica]CAG4884493.1 protein of unknown function [Georgfuchsia toluolica]
MLRSAVALLASAALHGCSWYVYEASNRPIASNIAGRCFALRENAILAEHFSYFTAYMLNLSGANDCIPQDVTPTTKDEARYKLSGLKYPKCIWVPVANVAKETKFKVTTVTEQPHGRSGRCWKVEVTLITGESAGIKSGIPACHLDFTESELWVRMKSGHEYVEPLELSDRVTRPCTE